MKRIGLLLLGIVAGLGIVAAAAYWARGPAPATAPLHGLILDKPQPALDFALAQADGRLVRLSDFRGRLALVYFGYTFCPDVCPTTLTDIARARRGLGASAADVQVIMISIDPERDTPARMADYARSFDPTFIGLSGTLAQIAPIASAYGVFFQKEAAAAGSNYTMTHTSIVTVVDGQGVIRVVWPFGVTSSEMGADLRALLQR